jgi:small subunit ribosomal protein S15
MSTKTIVKSDIISKFASHAKDTGSPAVQIAILSNRINQLAAHLKTHKKDNSSRKGLLRMVGQRRRLIEYLKTTSQGVYTKIRKDLNI